MTTPAITSDTGFVPAEVWLRAWVLPIVTTSPAAAGIGSKLWTAGLPKPYRAVRRISGPMTEYSDEPLMWVHTFGADYTSAATAAGDTDKRVLDLVSSPGWSTVLPDGRVVHCDWAEIVAAAHEEPYSAESVVTRFVSEFRFGLSLVSTSQ
jgi:hypothetical protein